MIQTASEAMPIRMVETAACWYALHTRARHEKQVSARLRGRDVEAFLPLYPRVSHWHDRRKVVHQPLFPGYVFARFPLETLTYVVATPGVASVVRSGGRPSAISEEEIENVRRFAAILAETGVVPETIPFLAEGQTVRVLSGPFRNVQGVVREQRGRRVLLQVGLRAIGRGLRVELDAGALKPEPPQ